jgi:hypothetical protein
MNKRFISNQNLTVFLWRSYGGRDTLEKLPGVRRGACSSVRSACAT